MKLKLLSQNVGLYSDFTAFQFLLRCSFFYVCAFLFCNISSWENKNLDSRVLGPS